MGNPQHIRESGTIVEASPTPDMVVLVMYIFTAALGAIFSVYCAVEVGRYVYLGATRGIGWLSWIQELINHNILGFFGGLAGTCFAASTALDMLAQQKAARLASKKTAELCNNIYKITSKKQRIQ
jgi:hypothetical protein